MCTHVYVFRKFSKVQKENESTKKNVNKQQNEVVRIQFVVPLAYFEHKIKR